MAKVLYIQASPRGQRSKSIQVADAFMDAYKAVHPGDTVDVMNLFTCKLPEFDAVAVQGKYNIMQGKAFSEQEKKAWDAVVKTIEHFKSFDKYVFAVPMWNLGIPYKLKMYIDIIVQPGLTFAVSDNGYEGLVKNKPVMSIYACGGDYSSPEAAAMDMQKRYLEQVLCFIGFTQIQSIAVEPTMHGSPDQIEAVVNDRKKQARDLAMQF